jgi:hypothetical protein
MGQWPTLLVIATASLVLSNIGTVSATPRLVCYFNSGASLRKGKGNVLICLPYSFRADQSLVNR